MPNRKYQSIQSEVELLTKFELRSSESLKCHSFLGRIQENWEILIIRKPQDIMIMTQNRS